MMFKHGGVGTTAYRSWRSMVRRCTKPNDPGYADYGGRGIMVCERWLKYANFQEDMGLCPKGLTLERINVNGNYEPSNCKWADSETQCNNRRGLKKFLVDGEWRTRAQLARHWNLNYYQAEKRVNDYPMKVVGEE